MRHLILRERNVVCKENILKVVKVGVMLIVVTAVGIMVINNADMLSSVLSKVTNGAIVECNNVYDGVKHIINNFHFGNPKVVEEVIIQGAKFN